MNMLSIGNPLVLKATVAGIQIMYKFKGDGNYVNQYKNR
jgi:hypothetical protein